MVKKLVALDANFRGLPGGTFVPYHPRVTNPLRASISSVFTQSFSFRGGQSDIARTGILRWLLAFWLDASILIG